MTNENVIDDKSVITKRLVHWSLGLKMADIPQRVQDRAKMIILDGVGCGLIGAHLPWSEVAAKAVFEIESAGPCSIFGWREGLSGPAAALLNSTFIQAFELDDWHPRAPIHSAAVLLPALFAATEHVKKVEGREVSGGSFLLAVIVGLEIGPRIGLGLGGGEMLSRGWHSGAVFGGPAVAMAVAKLLDFSERQADWALGTSCTQAGGLMSAQFGSMAKRMQHGFAARNGLLAALLARAGYTGIENVLDLPYGGFLSTFSAGTHSSSETGKESILAGLGSEWEVNHILIKPYPLMAGLHAAVDCVRTLQERYGDDFNRIETIREVRVELGEAAYKHGGWTVETDSLEVTGAQMNVSYAVALQLVDRKVVPTSFNAERLNRSTLFDLMRRTKCVHQKTFDKSLTTRVTVSFNSNLEVSELVEAPKGVRPPLGDEEVLAKWETGLSSLIDEKRKDNIKTKIMTIDILESLDGLLVEIQADVKNVLALP